MNIDQNKRFKDFFDKIAEKRQIDFLVLHHIESQSTDEAIAELLFHKVSSHFLIDEGGKIMQLVDENDVAYHAGYSHWQGFNSLNKNSIGIEFLNSKAFEKRFEIEQMRSGAELCQYLIAKYKIKPSNIVGHSDIAYFPDSGLLDRKQDPSHFFDWKFLADNNIGIYPNFSYFEDEDKILFELGNKDIAIFLIKENLQKFGYKVTNLNQEFDLEMQALVRVFHRRFNQEKFNQNSDVWYWSSQMILEKLISYSV